MAAVLALVMLPVIASIGFFVAVAHGSLSAAFASFVFVALACFVLFGALSVARNAEGPTHN
jgi:hypothetical protein